MPGLRVRLLGELAVDGCDPTALGRRQARTLLKVLALNGGRPVSVERLTECLWAGDPPTRAADQISVHVSRLRKAFDSASIRRSDAGYALALAWCDVDAIDEYAKQSEQRFSTGSIGAARAAATAGLALVRGRLLADEPDAWWAHADRLRVDRIVARLHHAAARAALIAGDANEAASLAQLALDSDPFDEAALGVLMEALNRAGRPGSALGAYAEVRARLSDQLGVSPSPETEAIHHAILMAGDVSASIPTPMTEWSALAPPGRDEAMKRLWTMLADARSGHGTVVVVEGEAGIGKSTVLSALDATAQSSGITVVRVGGEELGRTRPIQPLFDAIAELVRRHGPTAQAAEQVLRADAAVLGPLLGVQTEATTLPNLAAITDPGTGEALMFAAVTSVLRREAERAPLVLIIDDLHLAGPGTAAWLSQSVSRLADAPILVAAARREEEGGAVPGAATVHLAPLDLADVAVIVGEERSVELHRRSGGHPLFLVELAAHDAEEMPDTIRHAVAGRCARAGEAAATLRTAAVIGPTVDLDLLAEVTGAPTADLLDHLEEGVRRRLLVEDDVFEFTHGLIREALASTVGATRTALIHRDAGRALSRRPTPDPLIVAHHARLGGDADLAAAMLISAARGAVARFAPAAAATMLNEAICLHDSAEARIERARVGSMLGRFSEVSIDIAEAVHLGAGAEAFEVGAWAAHLQRHFNDALAQADRGAASTNDPELRGSCLALGGWVSLATGDVRGADRRLTKAAHEQPMNPMVSGWLAWLHVAAGRPKDALPLVHHEQGHGLSAYRFPNAYALMAGTMALAMVGRPDQALATADELTRELARMDAARWAPRPLNLRGWIVRNLGEAAEADDLNAEALSEALRLDQAEPRTQGLLDLAAGRLLVDDLDGARARLAEVAALADVEHAFQWRAALRLRLLEARFALAAGEAPKAFLDATALASDAAALGAPRYEVQARLVAAMAATPAGAERPPPDAVGALLHRLDDLAGLEAWWITADVAECLEEHAWRTLAVDRVAALLPRAGGYGAALTRAAARRRLDG